jgi:hypothetical protein
MSSFSPASKQALSLGLCICSSEFCFLPQLEGCADLKVLAKEPRYPAS